jgi:O-methyltransferase involved in polyketide biosynthesis
LVLVSDDMVAKFDPGVATSARVYDVLLGGKDNYIVDRDAAGQVYQAFPDATRLALANRRFLVRAVTAAVTDGVRQVIDIGTGLPGPSPLIVPDAARRAAADVKVLGVDNDPVVLSHYRALEERDGVSVIPGDIRRPQQVIEAIVADGRIDFARPVAVVFGAILHFIADEDLPGAMTAAFRDRMAPGSRLIVSHATSTGSPPEMVDKIVKAYAGTASQARFRTAEEILGLFDGFTLEEPGLVDVQDWRRSDDMDPRTAVRFLCAMGVLGPV